MLIVGQNPVHTVAAYQRCFNLTTPGAMLRATEAAVGAGQASLKNLSAVVRLVEGRASEHREREGEGSSGFATGGGRREPPVIDAFSDAAFALKSITRVHPSHAGTSVALGTRVEERQPDTVFGLIPALADRLLPGITARLNWGLVPDLYVATTELLGDALAFIARVAGPLAESHRVNVGFFGDNGGRYWFVARHPIEAAWFADALLREAGEIAHEAFGVGIYDFVHNVWGQPEAGFDVWLTGGRTVVRYHRQLPSVSFLAREFIPRPVVKRLPREPQTLVRGVSVPIAEVWRDDRRACALGDGDDD